MSEQNGTETAEAPPAALALAAAFGALVLLTIDELAVAGMAAERAARITALAGLLMAKVGLVLSFFMHARASRRAAALTVAAIGFAVGVAVVLMLEAVFRAGTR